MKNLDNNKVFKKVFNKDNINKLLFILGLIIILTYFGFYIVKQPIVDEEVRPEITNNLIPWEIKTGDNIVKAIVERPFDLKITEYGQYRPRYLAFLVQMVDENIFLVITRLIPFFGNRQPFYFLAAFLSVFSIYYFLKTICKNYPKGLSFFLSTSVLLFQNYQVATYWRARSAKLLTLSVCVFLITYVLKRLDLSFEKKDFKKLLLFIPIFLLMTLDEQVIALVAFLALLSFIFCIINKKINLVTIITSMSCLLYGTYHLWWGKALFKHFTGSLQRHGHTISGSLTGISFQTLFHSLRILREVIPKFIFLSFIIFFVIWMFLFVCLLLDKNKTKKEKLKKTIISIFLGGSPVILLMLMIDAHPAIYSIKCLWISVYVIVPTVILLLSLLYLANNVDLKKYNTIKFLIIFLGITVSLVYNIFHINSNYYGAYLDVKGGFSDSFSDLIVTKNEIKTDVIKTKEFNIDNDNLLAILNTPFSTENIKTTKVIKGFKNNKVYDGFEGYFITKENRKLVLDFNVESIGKNEKIDIYINNDKTSIDLLKKNNKVEISVSAERNRACLVKIYIKGNNKYLNVNKIYMK